MSTVKKISRLQRRVYEIGMVGRLAHNLAKFIVGTNGAYTAEEFEDIVRNYMVERGVEAERIEEYVALMQNQAQQEVEFFRVNGRFADSAGGTNIYIGALIGPILDELGYVKENMDC
jgi:hypothetical protein